MVRKVNSIPLLPLKATQIALELSLKRSRRISSALKSTYNPLFEAYREDLQGYFSQNFSSNIDSKSQRAVWSLSRAKKLHSFDTLKEHFIDMVDSAEDDAEEIMSDELTAELEESYFHGLWAIHESGIDVEDLPENNPGDEESQKKYLIAMGVAGLSYIDRLKLAGSIAKKRFLTWIRASLSGEISLSETLQGYDQAVKSLLTRTSLLAENENHRSFLLGSDLAYSAFPSQIKGEVWLARPDSCKLCAPLNMTITSEIPITSTHPGCRCYKVPIVLDYSGRPVDYVDFLQSIGMR